MSSDSNRVEELIGKYLDGVLDRQGEHELSGLLAASADARKLLAAHMRMQGALWVLCKAGVIQTAAQVRVRPKNKLNFSSRNRLVMLLTGLAACLAVVVTSWFMFPANTDHPIAVVEEIRDAMRRSGNQTITLTKGTAIHHGDSVATTDLATIRFPDGSLVTMEESSDATFLRQKNGGNQIDLHGGTLQLYVAKQQAGNSMVLKTSQVNVVVLGTKFLVEASQEFTEVEVEEGAVRLEALRGEQAAVTAKPGEVARVNKLGQITVAIRSVGEVKPTSNAVVYWNGSAKRVHVMGCKRLSEDPADLAKMTKMTLAEALQKGLPLCSRCPGSTTPGR